MKLLGKEKTLKYFERAIKADAVSHLYILEGEKGIGKKTVADYLAKKIHCTGENTPCGVCPSCHKHESSNHPDIVPVLREKDKAGIGVETVREAIADMYVKPLLADKKIYIIYEGELLSAQAQNALLKILEEPPEYIMIFILTTTSDALLKTVISRGVPIKIDRCGYELMKDYIMESYPSVADKADVICSFAGGVIGVANDMAEGGGVLSLREQLYKMLPALTGTSRASIYEIVSFFERHKDEINLMLDLIHLWLRDAIVIKTAEDRDIINKDYKTDISSFAEKVTAGALVRAADRISDVLTRIGKGSNITLWITNLLIYCWEDFHGENNWSQI